MATMTDLGRNYYLIQIAIAKKTEEQIVYCYKFLNREMIALNNILFDMYLLSKIQRRVIYKLNSENLNYS